MPIREVLILAFESLYANKLRASLTMLGMIIGVGAVVLLVSIGNGARNYITKQFEGLGTNLIVVQPGKTDKKMSFGPPVGNSKEKLTLADVDALEKQSAYLDAVTGILFGAGTVKTLDRSNNVNILGTNDKFVKIFNIIVTQGQFFATEEEHG
ncbi:MAG: ABC transporter permease, partial [Deltaproteobacteria bacterium]|nr:ABC transporter permease [Deltaproteobacteria bacterium]